MRGDIRTAGLLVNPNSLALMAFLVPSILSSTASRSQRLLADLVAVAVIISTGTSGALVAYVLGAILGRLNPRSAVMFGVVALVAVGLVVTFHAQLIDLLGQFKTTERIAMQAQIVLDNSGDLPAGVVDFGALNHAYGESALSGIWRLVHWLRIFQAYVAGGIDVITVGKYGARLGPPRLRQASTQ